MFRYGSKLSFSTKLKQVLIILKAGLKLKVLEYKSLKY